MVAALAAVGECASELDAAWKDYLVRFGKETQPEDAARRAAWEESRQFIMDHNLAAELGRSTFKLGENAYSDLPHTEFVRMKLGLYMNHRRLADEPATQSRHLATIPDAVDWRDEGWVTPVKDQAQCGSCWAFSTTGSMEGALAKATGNLVSLSEQNLVDCDNVDAGCNGGLMENAFPWIMQNGGINTEDDYPYQARDMSCRFDANKATYTISGFHEIKEQDEADLTEKLATEGPISVAIDAGRFSFQLYHSGVYYEPSCSSTRLNHGVLAFGYGNEDGSDFYWVKNSWGTSWGDNGYIKMSRNRNNNCGIATDASWPVA